MRQIAQVARPAGPIMLVGVLLIGYSRKATDLDASPIVVYPIASSRVRALA